MGQGASIERSLPPFPLTEERLTRSNMDLDGGTIRLPPGHMIECSLAEVEDLCLSKFDVPEIQAAVRAFASIVGMIVRYEIAALATDIRHNYRLCTPGVPGQRLRRRRRQEGREAEVHAAQLKFIEEFCTILNSADYCAVSQKEWDIAVEESFMFTLPVQIQWHCFDAEILGRFLDDHPRLKAYMPSFSDRILVFWQGSSIATQRRWMFREKVERVLYLALFRPVLDRVKRHFGICIRDHHMCPSSPRPPKRPPLPTRRRPISLKSAVRLTQLGLPRPRSETLAKDPVADDVDGAEPQQSSQPEEVQNIVQRVGFTQALPTVWSVIRNFHRRVQLTEPTLKNVAVVYCHSLPGEREAQNDPDVKEQPDSVRIKLFHDIPLADLEVVFPFKSVRFRYLDLLMSLVTILVGVFLIVKQTLHSEMSGNVLRGVVLIVGARAFSVFQGMQKAKVQMEKEMQRTFVHKSRDNDEGALFYLMESWETQELKEMLLAYTYCVVLMEERTFGSVSCDGVDIQELKAFVEEELRVCLGIDATFNVEGAVRNLALHRIVQRAGDRVTPVPIAEAVESLKATWSNYINSCCGVGGKG
eukprot:EG_transcript_6450